MNFPMAESHGAGIVFLLTYHGSIVCVRADGLELRHYPIGAVPTEFRPLRCSLSGVAEISVSGTDTASRYALERVGAGDRTAYLRRARRYLRAVATGALDVQVEEPSGWERFLLLNPDEYAMLETVLTSNWVRKPGILVAVGDVHVGDAFQLNGLDQRRIDLSGPFPLSRVQGDLGSLFLFCDGWRIEELRRFKPLVYYSAFGSDAHLELFCLAVESFEHLHPGLAHYLLFTDANEALLRERLASPLSERLQIIACQTCDPLDFYIQRYRIADVPGVEAYSPLLYLDTDVMACADATPLLMALTLSDAVEAGEEVFSPMLTRESVGSHLMAEDGIAPPWEFGFNSGALGFSDVRARAGTLQATIETTLRYADARGRVRLGGWFDQAPANYVAAKLGGFGTKLMTPYLVQVLPSGREAGATPALIHFWGTGGRKLEIMREHLATLKRTSRS